MNILITGSDTFIGRNLKAELINRGYRNIYEINKPEDSELLEEYIDKCDVVIHLLTIYKSDDITLYNYVNVDFTRRIVNLIKDNSQKLILLSSTQSGNSSVYGQTKKEAEEIALKELGLNAKRVCIFRVANEFGKWCPPNLNSVVATFFARTSLVENLFP